MDRFLPWDNLGYDVSAYNKTSEALEAAGMNWEVVTRPVFFEDLDGSGKVITDKLAVVRKDTGEFLSEISARKNVINNTDAFNFIDKLTNETGGKLTKLGFRDNASYGIVELPEEKIVDDGVAPYMIIKNSFDGGTPLTVFMSPYRLACLNQVADAASKSKRLFKSDFYIEDEHRQEAVIFSILNIKKDRMAHLNSEASAMVNAKVSEADFYRIVNQLYPTDDELTLSQNKIAENNYYKEAIHEAYNQEDLANFRGTAWGVFNAFSDFVSHTMSYKDYKNSVNFLPTHKLKDIENRVALLVNIRYILSQQYGLNLKY